VMTEYEQSVAQGCLGSPGAFHQGWIRGRRQIARAFDTALGSRV
jgi:hypothetical protein